MGRKVLLIGWDGADWEHITPLLDSGQLPTLEKMINRGVMGNLATLQPVLSPMLWNSAATGKHAYKHGIHGFIEPDPHHGGARPFTSYSRKSKAIWNILNQVGKKSNVINYWASHPAEKINGCVVTNAFGGISLDPKVGLKVSPGTIHPEDRTKFLRDFKVFPQELTGEQLCPFVPRATEVEQEDDSRLEMLAKVLSETMTTHSVGTAVMETEPWDLMVIYYTGIDHFSHAFMQYHPPRLAYVPERDFEIYSEVINSCYRFHDMMLERLLHLAGEDTTVILCSDHGFQSGELRPRSLPREPAGPAVWHRQYGIFVACGPDLKKDERIYGASLIDIGPTVLSLFDLPVGEDMDGRPLLEIYQSPPQIDYIPSWEDRPGDSGMHQTETPIDADAAADLMQQFAALGYIDDPGQDKQEQAESADTESKYNLARNLSWLKRTSESIRIMEELVRRSPWETRFILQLMRDYQHAGYLQQAINLIEAAFDLESTKYPSVRLNWAEVQIKVGNAAEALPLLEQVEKSRLNSPAMFNQIGKVYLRLKRFNDALRLYHRSLEIHPDNAEAFRGLATIYRRLGDNDQTIEAALSALSLVYRWPQTHFDLGVALARSGEVERAILAFETALKFGPRFAMPHRWLATIYRSQVPDAGKADFHAEQFRKIRASSSGDQTEHRARRQKTFPLPDFPPEEERREIAMRERPMQTTDRRKRSGKEFVIVSGLPRSGTSLMMQMLQAGGLPPKTDAEREADADNPKGYFEWEAVKQLGKDPGLFNEEGLDQQAIKVVSMLVPHLPFNHQYKVIFLTRPVEEVIASQNAMVARLGTDGADKTDAEMVAELQKHRDQILHWMRHHPRLSFLEVYYPGLVENPDEWIEKVVEFLGPERLPQSEKIGQVIDRSLYRQRASQENSGTRP